MTDNATTAPLIYLDVDDEITSVASRIRAAEADTVTLVLPFGSRVATSRINFRLLAREAAERGKRIEIITADASARSLASAAGLMVHPSVAAFEGARSRRDDAPADGAATTAAGVWAVAPGAAGTAAGPAPATAPGAAGVPVGGSDVDDDGATRVISTPRKKSPAVPLVGPPRPPVRTGLAVGIGLAAVALVVVGGLLALQLLPAATIVLHPRAEPIQPLNLAVEARTDVTTVDPDEMLIPAQRVEFDVNATYTINATGVKVTKTKATGSVTFSNFDNGSDVFIPAGTIVRTQGGGPKVEFATIADVTLPKAQIDFFPPFPTRPSTASVGVEAVEPGEAGNVGNNAITDIPGGGRLLKVTNPEPTEGGSRTEAPEISEDDVDAAIEAIQTDLAANLDAQIAAGTGVPPGVTVFPESKVVGLPEYSVDPATLVGSTELEVDILASATGTALGVDAAPIETIARARLQGEVADGWSLDPDSVELTMSTPTMFGETLTYPFTIAGTQIREVDEAALIESIRGLGVPEARTVLAGFGDAEVSVWPDWVTTIPTNTDRITLTLRDPAAASPTS